MAVQFEDKYEVALKSCHLEKAQAGASHCVVNQALRDVFPECSISVGLDKAVINDGRSIYYYHLDEIARTQIFLFDKGMHELIHECTFFVSRGLKIH